MSSAHSLSDKFIDLLNESVGEESANAYLNSFSDDPVVSIRINPRKWSVADIDKIFPDIIKNPVPWSRYGFYLSERPSFTMDPLFHAGVYYVQEASSMYLEQCVEIFKRKYISEGENTPFSDAPTLRILDLCAAPGGKSTHLLSLFSEDEALFVLNEVIRSRVTILTENVAKWGYPNIVVTNNDASDFAAVQNYFDLIVADVPCSGEGMFRKDKRAINEWSYDNVMLCAARQKRIISDIWSSLKPGGYLIYSTCTFNHFENEDNIKWICENLGAEVVPDCGRQFIPGLIEGEGFFCRMLIKKREELRSEQALSGLTDNKKRRSGARRSGKITGAITKYLKNGYSSAQSRELIKAYPENAEKEMLMLEKLLNSVHSAVAVGELINSHNKEEQFIPHADLALSTVLNQSSFHTEKLSYTEAIRFLSLEPLQFPDTPNGYILLTYKDIPLGFVKNLGNRTNNLLPKSRRILKRDDSCSYTTY